MAARIVAASSAFPEHRIDSAQVKTQLRNIFGDRVPELETYARMVDRAGIAHRHLVLPVEETTRRRSLEEKNGIYIEKAQELAEEATRLCLAKAGVAASEVDALFTVSCTGFMIPSLDARLVGRMGFREDVVRFPVNEMGCAAGAWALSRCRERAAAVPGGKTLLVSVELPSLTFQPDDLSGANLLSSVLFGDGAVALLIDGGQTASPGIEILASRSVTFPDSLHLMGFELDETGFHIVLDRDIPVVISQQAMPRLTSFLTEQGLKRSDIGFWAIHPGGMKILDSMAKALDLGPRELSTSLGVWSRRGNLSSATVLCVLEEFMRTPPPAGTRGLGLAFGPGFCMELLLLEQAGN